MLIKIDNNENIEFSPKTKFDEIKQNIKTIISVNKNEQPLARGFGIDASFIDMPTNIARAKIATAVLKAVNENEPRVDVKSIDFEELDLEAGKICVVLEVDIVS